MAEARTQLLVGQHRQMQELPFDDLANEAPDVHRRQHHGGHRVLADIAHRQLHRGDELKSGRKDRLPADPSDADRSVLERLPQRLQRRPSELGQLVEKEDAVMSEADFSGPRILTAADESDI